MRLGIPVVNRDLTVWANNMRKWLGSAWMRLPFQESGSAATENGSLMWDAENGYPVVSKDGVFVPLILEDSPLDFGVKIAELEILNTYGDTVSVTAKRKTLLKFGRRDDLGTSSATVWQTNGNETYVGTNIIDTISASDVTDTEVISIEGHTVTGTGTSQQFTFTSQTATLNGQNKVVLTTPLARVSRASNTGSSDVIGDVYVYEDTAISGGVPTDLTKAHIKINAGEAQSYKAATTFSNTDYFICTGGFAAVDKKTSATVDFEMQVRNVGGVFRPVSRIALDSSAQTTQQIQFYPYVIIPKNADIRIVAVSSSSNTEVSASFQGFLAAVQ